MQLKKSTHDIISPMKDRFYKVFQQKARLVFDGAMGTMLMNYGVSEKCAERLNIENPEVIKKIHLEYVLAGADVIETNTFGSNSIVLNEFDLAEQTYELSRLGAELARRAVDSYSTPDHPRYVFGSIGPGTKLPSLGNTTFKNLLESIRDRP